MDSVIVRSVHQAKISAASSSSGFLLPGGLLPLALPALGGLLLRPAR